MRKVNGATPDVNGNVTIEVPEVDTSTLATKTELNAVASGSPKGAYATLADLQSAFPTGNANMYVVSANGKWYTWNGSAWTAGAIYTSAVTSPSIVKNKTFATADNRFEEIENDTYFLAGNKVKNGDFSNGKTDWYIPYSTSTVANNELSVVLTSKSAAGRIEQLTFLPIAGHKYYLRGDIKPKYASITSIGFGSKVIERPVIANQWNTVSSIVTALDSTNAFRFVHNTVLNYAVGDTILFKNLIAINLTEVFGAGLEPRKDEVETFLSNFPNSWFDGVKQLINPKQMFKLAAKPFKEKTSVHFGDSITADIYPEGTEYTATIAKETGLNTINVGFGGCMMSKHPAPEYDAFSMYQLANSIVSNNFTLQEGKVGQVPTYYTERINRLKALNWNDVSYVTIAYGTNDHGNPVLNSADEFDITTFKGAVNHSLKTLLTTYPHLKIIMVPPTFKFRVGYTGTDSDNWEKSGVKITDYITAINELKNTYKYRF
ncbi:SGNH/GDSL hydrolase family protein [Peribacillus frigoritolerans]|uniref:SGNH/GDSL hydrolase family protein n=1 Tax=Peribacillus frigoritolerans TaxID=450367 RepID=UPI001EFCEF6F|nr:SGNH/GDSL hydrolase family protein [Peribacillus frigoritolerans]ULM95670.1 SGNH/GDSL hydrolase family protein [Peribacillus frigoritolerans]